MASPEVSEVPFCIPTESNVLDYLRILPDNCVHVAATSPPYWGLRTYDGDQSQFWPNPNGTPLCESCNLEVAKGPSTKMAKQGSTETIKHPSLVESYQKWPNASGGATEKQSTNEGSFAVDYKDRRTVSAFCSDCGAWFGPLGMEPDPDLFADHLTLIFAEVRRVLRPDGVFFLNLGDSYSAGYAPTYDTSGKEQEGYSDDDYPSTNLCDGCREVSSHHTSHIDSVPGPESVPYVSDQIQDHSQLHYPSPDSLDSIPQPTFEQSNPSMSDLQIALAPDDEPPLFAPESTNPESSEQPPGECLHCDNCGVCLSVLGSSSREKHLCARRAQNNSDKLLPASFSIRHNQGRALLGKGYSANARLKPKDLVMMPARVALALQRAGWWVRCRIIWEKGNVFTEPTKDRPTVCYEDIYELTKSAHYYYDIEGVKELALTEVKKKKKKGKGIPFGGVKKAGGDNATYSGNLYHPEDHGDRQLRNVWHINTKPSNWDFCSICETYSEGGERKKRVVKRTLTLAESIARDMGDALMEDFHMSGETSEFDFEWHISEDNPDSDLWIWDTVFDTLQEFYDEDGVADGEEIKICARCRSIDGWIGHFAMWPPDLVERMIRLGSSDRGCCSECGTAWNRLTEKMYANPVERDQAKQSDWQGRGKSKKPGNMNSGKYPTGKVTVTIGWEPGCTCDAGTEPCVVLDPFMGSHTTGLVAEQMGRRWLGCDLSSTYIQIGEHRLARARARWGGSPIAPRAPTLFEFEPEDDTDE